MTAVPLTHANGTARPQLRSAPTHDRIAALADAMRGMLADPGSPEAQRELASVRSSCTDAEFEAAWSLVQPETPAAGRQYYGPPAGTRLLPVLTLPRQDPPPPATPATRTRRLPWRAVDGDTVITWSMAATVALVAVDAAIVSYSHIFALATGQQGSGTETGIQPRLLPLSIDGVIAEASLVLLFAARHKLRAPRLATFMLWLGIIATVAANVTHGLPSSLLPSVAHVVITALLSAWPAGAFIGSVEMAMQLVRASRVVASGDSELDRKQDKDGDTEDEEPQVSVNRDRDSDEDKSDGNGGARKPAPKRPHADSVTAMLRRHPDWDDDKIAAKCGVSKRTVSRRRKALEEAEAGQASG